MAHNPYEALTIAAELSWSEHSQGERTQWRSLALPRAWTAAAGAFLAWAQSGAIFDNPVAAIVWPTSCAAMGAIVGYLVCAFCQWNVERSR